MDGFLALMTAIASGAIALVMLWAILNPRVRDGVLVKLGLIAVMLGSGAIALRMSDGAVNRWDVIGIQRSLLLIDAGLIAIVVGYALRRLHAHHPMRRRSDWVDLDDGGRRAGGARRGEA